VPVQDSLRSNMTRRLELIPRSAYSDILFNEVKTSNRLLLPPQFHENEATVVSSQNLKEERDMDIHSLRAAFGLCFEVSGSCRQSVPKHHTQYESY
jgi:hypothetical protein